MQKHGIKTAKFEMATTREQLYDALKQFNPPYVVKLDGLAQGKGVIITHSFDEALDKGTKLMNGNMFENVKGPVVVDEYLDGWELSAIAIVNGGDFVLLPFTKDYKRAFTNDEGPNTGGMGAYGPVQIDEKLKGKITIIADGGVRSGADVLKLLALGADCVLIGRPVIIAVFGGGREALKLYFETIKNDLKQAMLLTGVGSVKNVSKDIFKSITLSMPVNNNRAFFIKI